MIRNMLHIVVLMCGLGFIVSITTENKIRTMQHLSTAVLGRKYGRHFAHHLSDAAVDSHEYVYAEHSRNPLKRLPFLGCSKLTDAQLLIQELQTRAIPYHRIAKSHNDNHYCIKADIHQKDHEYFEKTSKVEFTVLQPFAPLMKFDLSLLQLHSKYFDPHTSHLALHPIMQDVANGEKVGFSLVFTKETTFTHQQHFIRTLHLTLQSTLITSEMISMHSGHSGSGKASLLPRHLYSRPQKLNSSNLHIQAGINMLSSLATTTKSLHEVCSFQAHLDDESQVNLMHRGMFIKLPNTLYSLAHESQPLPSQATFAFCMYQIAKVIAQDDKIMKVGVSKPLKIQNNLARLILQTGTNSNTMSELFTVNGLNGSSGVVLGVSDTGIDENSCFFVDSVHGKVPRSNINSPTFDLKYRKVIQYVNYSSSSGDYSNGHGTHVAGTLAGYCSSTNNINIYHGMSSDAKLAFFDIGMNDKDQTLIVPYNLGTDLFDSAYIAGAKIHSNSWGGGYFYDAYCIAADEYVYQTQDFMPFFAVGNNGAQGRETALSPGLAKNVLAVGATQTGHYSSQNIDFIAFFSSMGPTLDGRTKPDILGPGFSLTSAMAVSENSPARSCSTSTKAGTSMATPAVAATAGLIQDYFQNPQFWRSKCNVQHRLCRRGSFSPNGALMKALVLHAGRNVSHYDGRASNFGFVELGPTPDSYQGYGRVRLDKLLPLTPTSAGSLYVDDMQSLASLTERTYRIFISNENAGKEELKVTLAWLDPPNDFFASQLLVQDLDLLVADPRGRLVYGNAPLYAFGAHRDEYNPHEQILIPASKVVAGNYSVRVQAKYFDSEAQYPRQPFAIVITTSGEVFEPPVDDPANSQAADSTNKLDVSLFRKCANYHAMANSNLRGNSENYETAGGAEEENQMLQVGIALWARVTSRGWSNSDFYSISKLNTSTLKVENVVIDQEKMTEKFALEIDEICLKEGIYSITMNLSSSAVLGSQLSLPDCRDYFLLTPVKPTSEVVILSGNENSSFYRSLLSSRDQKSTLASSASGNNGEAVCVPNLAAFSDHYLLPVNLTEYAGGSGWSGSYYTLFRLPFTAESRVENVILSGTMDWGLEQAKRVIVPLQAHTPSSALGGRAAKDAQSNQQEDCYALQLSYSSKVPEEEYPEIYFSSTCPYSINITTTMTQFCVQKNGQSLTTTMRFYEQPSLPGDLGQLPGGSAMYQEYARAVSGADAILIGSCEVNMKRSKGVITSNHVLDDADILGDDGITDDLNGSNSSDNFYNDDYYYSTTHGNNTTPQQPTFANYNLTCLSSCPNYPGNDSMYSDLQTSCLFFAWLFKSCDSYALSAGLCVPPHSCMQTCTVAMMCYLGAGSAYSCPLAGEGGRWRGDSNQSKALSQQCVNSFAASTESSSDTDSDNRNGGGTAKVLIIAVVVIAFFVALFLLWSHCRKRSQNSNAPLAGNSLVRSDGPTETTPTTASKIMERGKNLFQKKLRQPGKSQQQYEMVPVDGGEVRNPFTIRNDDEEDEEYVGDEELGQGFEGGMKEGEDVSNHSNRAFELGDEDDGDLRL